MTWRFERLAPLALLGLVAACTEVNYVQRARPEAVGASGADETFGRQVEYHLARAFYETPPACVMVIPAELKDVPRPLARTVADTVARHLTTRVERVIDAGRTGAEARRRAYDPTHGPDRRRLAGALDCDTVAEIDGAGVETVFAVVWTDIAVNIRLTLRRARDGAVIWRGRHRARRGDGAMPITLFGAGAGTVAAGRLAGDADALPSLIDDSVRRMMASLPDARNF